MKVVVREKAEEDLDRIFAWIAKYNPRTEADMVSQIRDHINLLELDNVAHMGRPGLVNGTRELIEYPYIIIYSVDDRRREIDVLSIMHGAQQREGGEA